VIFFPFPIIDLLSTPCIQKAEAKEAEPMSVDSEAWASESNKLALDFHNKAE
jgi:hypothetical protein